MGKEYWYVGVLSAEETCMTPVHLTRSEEKAVRKFLDQLEIHGFCGSCCLHEEKYDTEAECRSNCY